MLLLCSFNAWAEPVYWIDVRTGFEYGLGHIEGAINIPYDEISSRIKSITEDKDAKIHLYCRSGNRSGKALKTLQSLGYTKAINEGGYNEISKRPK